MTYATEDERRRALAAFLRSRRARISPQQLGLPSGGRRRTPGLRREELAQLAGVGATWYTWLEQGRPIRVSVGVLESIARVLGLSTDERDYLFVLARAERPLQPATPLSSLAPAVQPILDRLAPFPAYVLDAGWNVVAWNSIACAVVADWEVQSGRTRNLLWFMLTDPERRQRFEHWEEEAQRAIAIFRASTGRFVGEEWHRRMVSELSAASPEFAAWWPRNDLQGTHTSDKVINHPEAGALRMLPTTWQLAEAPELRMVVYTPVDEQTSQKLARLHESHAIAGSTL